MKLMPLSDVRKSPQHHATDHEASASTRDGIEWEDGMSEINRMTTPANMRWKIVDRETNAENSAIKWDFNIGNQVKIRLINENESDHPMHHPFHIHGAGRFVVLTRDGIAEPNLVWKDTVLVRAGQTVDILLDVTNPGRWMAHCHISEHHESGMMFSFDVQPRPRKKMQPALVANVFKRSLKLILGDHYEHVLHTFTRAKATDLDPVCGMSITRDSAGGRLDYKGRTYFFCSAGCKTKFAANPTSYAQPKTISQDRVDRHPRRSR
jgi:YHS domain-containing protein